jgi:hypothetical protein
MFLALSSASSHQLDKYSSKIATIFKGSKKKKAEKLIFGGYLEDHCVIKDGSFCLPDILERAIAVVENRGLDSVGIYRLSGNTVSIQKLKSDANAGKFLYLTFRQTHRSKRSYFRYKCYHRSHKVLL